MTITVTTSGFVTFQYTYYANGEPATFWGITPTGDTVYVTYNELGEVLTFVTVPAPAKPPATSTAGTTNNNPPLFQAIGSPIPIVWGRIRVKGAQLWSGPTYSGGGIGNVVDVAVAWGTPLETNGLVVGQFYTALWGNGNLFYKTDGGIGSPVISSSIGNFGLTDYVGDEVQNPDPNLQLVQGTNGTPAFRGLIYTFFKGLSLSPFNNSVSATTFYDLLGYLVSSYGRYSLSYVIDHLAQRGGFAAGAFTVSSNITDACDGGQISSSTDFISLLQGLSNVYDFLILEHPLRLKRVVVGGGLTIDKVIAESDCVATSTSDDVVLVSDAEPWTIPNQISLSYISASLDYQVATVPVKRPIFPFGLTGPLRIQNYSLPLVLTDDEAANLAWLYLYRLWEQSRTLTFTALPKHMDVEPGDVIQITSHGVTYTAVVKRSTIKPDFTNQLICTSLLTNSDINLTGDPGAVKPEQLVCPVTDWTTLDAFSSVGCNVTNCGLRATCVVGDGGARSLSFRTSGKYFFQAVFGTVYGAAAGVAEAGASYSTASNGIKQGGGAAVVTRGGLCFSNGTATNVNIGAGDSGDIYSFAVDLDLMLFWVKRNNNNWNGISLADPSAAAFGISMSAFAGQQMSPVVSFGAITNVFDVNFGQSSFVDKFGNPVPVPTGFTHGWPV